MGPVVLCSEAGGGRGHMVKLSIVARALRPMAEIVALVGRTDQAHVLMPFCKAIYPATKLRLIGAERVRREFLDGREGRLALNWPSWLTKAGFFCEDLLRSRFAWWHETFLRLRPELVVAEYAPTALLAARALGIPSCATGNAYGLPPATMASFPSLAMGKDNGIVLNESRLLDTVNTVTRPYGLGPLTALPEIYRSDVALPTGVKHWDPYAEWRQDSLLLPLAEMPPLTDATGKELFIYFSWRELEEPSIQEALAALKIPARCFALNLSERARTRLEGNPRIAIESAPVPQRAIVANSRMVLCAGQAGTLALGVLSGLPVLALPCQSEQGFNAGRAAHLASCISLNRRQRTKEGILSAISGLWTDPAVQSTARTTALSLRAEYREGAIDGYRRHLGTILAKHRIMGVRA